MRCNRPDGVELIDYRLIVAFDENLHAVAVVRNSDEADAVRTYLGDQGVLVTVRGEFHEWLMTHYGAARVELGILVPNWQRAYAEELLAEYDIES